MLLRGIANGGVTTGLLVVLAALIGVRAIGKP
jgi:hypothetical protein